MLKFWKWLFRIVLVGIVLLAVFILVVYFTLPDTSILIEENPKTTAIIEQRIAAAKARGRTLKIRQKWVSFNAIPDMLKKTVRITEDANFYFHQGIDFEELQESLKKNFTEGKVVRGGSTITQQLAKNLYLSTDRSLLRKIREYFITQRLEGSLSKDRIMHLYLNVIEFGPGIFGVEAAARYYFGKTAIRLDIDEIVRLVAVIPKPLKVKPTGSSRWLYWKCCWITRKLKLYKYIDQEMYEQLSGVFC